MNIIELHNVVPEVFSHQSDWSSDVWHCDEVKFEKGEIYLVEANSGTGKSTLCSYLLGYRHDYSGQITIDGRDIKTYGVGDWVEHRKNRMAMLFQELRLFSELTAIENIEIKNVLSHNYGRKQIEQWFERLGIADKINSPLRLMSFGQQQRVAMMRALVQPYDYIMVDEPISHLDEANAKIMGQILLEESAKREAAIIVTSIGKHMDLPYKKTFKL